MYGLISSGPIYIETHGKKILEKLACVEWGTTLSYRLVEDRAPEMKGMSFRSGRVTYQS